MALEILALIELLDAVEQFSGGQIGATRDQIGVARGRAAIVIWARGARRARWRIAHSGRIPYGGKWSEGD
jgi:hypothetical protein